MVEPKYVYAGDTIGWTRTLDAYPAPAWTLTYSFVKAGDSITVTATASGSDHVVAVAPAVSAAWTPGEYRWQAYVTDAGGARYTLADRGTLTVRPDPTAGGYDTRSVARVMLENIEAYLKDPNNLTAASYAINNRSLSRWSRADLLVERDRLKAEIRVEDAEDRIAAGLGNARQIRVRFDRA